MDYKIENLIECKRINNDIQLISLLNKLLVLFNGLSNV